MGYRIFVIDKKILSSLGYSPKSTSTNCNFQIVNIFKKKVMRKEKQRFVEFLLRIKNKEKKKNPSRIDIELKLYRLFIPIIYILEEISWKIRN